MNAIYVNINVGQTKPSMSSKKMVGFNDNRQPSSSLPSSPQSSVSDSSAQSSSPEALVNANYVHPVPKGLANHAMFDPIRYKTEMCKNFMELGECKFGPKCYYAHFGHELKVATYKHKNYKTQLCKPFHSDGFCDFGARCAFIHTKPDVDEILVKLNLFLNSAPPMPHFDTEEEVFKEENQMSVDLKSMNGKRLKIFEKLSSK